MKIKFWVNLLLKSKTFMVVLSSFLLFLSYPKISLSPIAFVALVPFIIILFNLKKLSEALKYGFLLGFSTYLLLLYWIYNTLQAAGVNFFISILALILLSFILSVEFIIITIGGYIANIYGTTMMVFILPSIWVIVDFIKHNITKHIVYFPWFDISYSQWNNPFILNLAHFGQSYTITFLIVLVNCIISSIILSKGRREKIKKFIAAFALIAASVGFGWIKYNDISNLSNKSEKSIKVAIIQPSIDFYAKWDESYYDYIKMRIEALIDNINREKADLIIWPENALFGWIDDPDVFEWLCSNIKKSRTYHIVGSISKSDRKYVSAYLINPDCEIVYKYNKRVLVPFGEYVPFRKFLGKYINVITSLGEFEEGPSQQKPFNFKNFKLGVSICYETIFKWLFYEDEDIDFLVNITNDGWYLNTSAPYQHFSAAIMRSVENGRTFIRSANNGISAIIEPNGKISSMLKLNDYGYIATEIKPIKLKRQNDIEKNIFFYISVMIFSAFILAMIFRR
ncbi:MAG: apolipoprotein N-acyltransferase [Elusimicrobiota bacterium]